MDGYVLREIKVVKILVLSKQKAAMQVIIGKFCVLPCAFSETSVLTI